MNKYRRDSLQPCRTRSRKLLRKVCNCLNWIDCKDIQLWALSQSRCSCYAQKSLWWFWIDSQERNDKSEPGDSKKSTGATCVAQEDVNADDVLQKIKHDGVRSRVQSILCTMSSCPKKHLYLVVHSFCPAVTRATIRLCFYINGVNDRQGPDCAAEAGERANLQFVSGEQMFMAHLMERCSSWNTWIYEDLLIIRFAQWSLDSGLDSIIDSGQASWLSKIKIQEYANF